MCVVRARVALALAYVCMQGMTRAHVAMKCKEKMVPFIFIAPMHSYVTNVFVYNLPITIFSRVYSYVTRMYSYVTPMLLVCYSCVLVCNSYVTHVYSYVLVCYSCVVLVTISTSHCKL